MALVYGEGLAAEGLRSDNLLSRTPPRLSKVGSRLHWRTNRSARPYGRTADWRNPV